MIQPLRLAFGTMQFGGGADEAASAAMFDACRAAGITHFDTACGYTGGAAETILGALAADQPVFVATKVGYEGGAGRANIAAQFEGSLRRLRRDRVDLLYLHRFDPEVPMQETLETFAAWQAAGRIGQIGLSNHPAWAVMKAQAVAALMGTRIDAIQPMYNLIKRQAEVELLPMAADQAMAVYAYSPLAGGLLTGKYGRGEVGRLTTDARYAARYAAAGGHEAAAKLAVLAADWGHDAATLAVAWVMARGVVPIISARTTAQLAPALAAKDLVLTPQQIAALSALIPPPPPATDRSEES